MLNENVDEEFVRKIAAQVVKEEMVREVYPIKEWMWSLWSNGSGRPEGYLQMARKADDLRYRQLADETKEQSGILRELKDNMLLIAQDKKNELELKERRAKRIAFWWPIIKWVAVGLTGAVITAGSWAIGHIAPVVKVLWEDYLHAHPAAMHKLKNLSQYTSDPVYADGKNSADLPPIYVPQ